MIEKILVIHPNFPKTGTTSFQNLLKSININILAKPTIDQTKTIWFKFLKESLYPANQFSGRIDQYNFLNLKKDFKNYLKEFFKNQKKISVLSDEGLLGRFDSVLGFYNLNILKGVIEEIEKELNIKMVIKVVLTIREQHDLILSTYFHNSIHFSKDLTLEIFLKRFTQSKDYENIFNYTHYIKKIKKIFNSEVLILPLELMERNPEIYIDKFCKFIEINEAFSGKMLNLNNNHILIDAEKRYFERKWNSALLFKLGSIIHTSLKKIKMYDKNFKNSSVLNNIYYSIKPKKNKKVTSQDQNFYKKEIKELYKDSNIELEKTTDLNLKELGYY